MSEESQVAVTSGAGATTDENQTVQANKQEVASPAIADGAQEQSRGSILDAKNAEAKAVVESIKLKVPEAFKDKGYMKNLVDENGEVDAERMFKEIDGLQHVKGKKEIAFDFAKATTEEKTAYFERVRPKEFSEYEVKGLVAEGTEETIQKIMHESGLEKGQAKMLVEKYIAVEQAQYAKMISKEGFVNEMKASFGDNHQSTVGKIEGIARQTLTETDLKILDGLPNAQLGLVYRFVDKLIRDYGVTETGKGEGVKGVVQTSDDAQKEADTLWNELFDLKKKPNYDAGKHKDLVERYNKALAKAQAKGGK